jgi:hypothetical protein
VAATPVAVEPDQSVAPVIAEEPPTATPGPIVTPTEEAPPVATEPPPVKTASAPPPAAADRPPPRPVPVLGTIRVVTDPSVDVLLDGKHRGKTKGSALVIPKVTPGERMVTLRLNSREQTLLAAVHGGETATVTYRFPPELPQTPAEKTREALERKPREALGKLRDGVEKAHREAVGALRDILDGVDPAKRGHDR